VYIQWPYLYVVLLLRLCHCQLTAIGEIHCSKLIIHYWSLWSVRVILRDFLITALRATSLVACTDDSAGQCEFANWLPSGGCSRVQSLLATRMTSICSYPWICVIRVPRGSATAIFTWRQMWHTRFFYSKNWKQGCRVRFRIYTSRKKEALCYSR